MIRKYKIEDSNTYLECSINIDPSILSEADAKLLLEFFSWSWDRDANIYDELAKKYAMSAFNFATQNRHNTIGVRQDFDAAEGYPKMDGSLGIELIDVEGYEFDDSEFNVTVNGEDI